MIIKRYEELTSGHKALLWELTKIIADDFDGIDREPTDEELERYYRKIAVMASSLWKGN